MKQVRMSVFLCQLVAPQENELLNFSAISASPEFTPKCDPIEFEWDSGSILLHRRALWTWRDRRVTNSTSQCISLE